jgi:hypothetical protein
MRHLSANIVRKTTVTHLFVEVDKQHLAEAVETVPHLLRAVRRRVREPLVDQSSELVEAWNRMSHATDRRQTEGRAIPSWMPWCECTCRSSSLNEGMRFARMGKRCRSSIV